VALRLVVEAPPADAHWAVQQGRDGLMPPAVVRPDAVTFEWDAAVADGPDGLAVRGPEVQGPRGGRFVYVNSGGRAGDAAAPSSRRAKVPLATLTPALLAGALAEPGGVLEARIAGAARDGGPACATVPLLGGGWRLAAAGR
jgi:hypothetical protein